MDFYKARFSKRKSVQNTKSSKNERNRNSRNHKPHSSFRNSGKVYSNHDTDKKMYESTCSECGQKCQLPFEPKFHKPVYCSKCFEKINPTKSRKSKIYERRDTSYTSNNHTLRQREEEPNSYRFKKEVIRSHESEKFYSSLKGKLFEILEGKVCSSCGFRDERALGFINIYDSTFDRIGRGGSASSWSKYISEPELARKELRVLCLNCNEIREPVHKRSEKPKKSRYFPR